MISPEPIWQHPILISQVVIQARCFDPVPFVIIEIQIFHFAFELESIVKLSPSHFLAEIQVFLFGSADPFRVIGVPLRPVFHFDGHLMK